MRFDRSIFQPPRNVAALRDQFARAGRRCHWRAFTLLELILVMLIMAVMAALIVPSLGAFARGRAAGNTATQMMALARFARSQAVADGTTYRLQLDPQGRTYQLTMQQGGAYVPVPGDFGEQNNLPDGVSMDVNITPQPNVLLVPPSDQTQTNEIATPPIGQPIAQANTVVTNQHQGGQYVEFDPSGRTDPVYIKISDASGHRIDLGCASSTEQMHVLTAGEMQ